MGKVVDFRSKDRTVKDVLDDLEEYTDRAESIMIIIKEKDGTVRLSCSTMLYTEAIGLLEVGKTIQLEEMRD